MQDFISNSLGFRKIARDAGERTAIFSPIPQKCGFQDGVYANIPKHYEKREEEMESSLF